MVNDVLGEINRYIEASATSIPKPIYKNAWGTTDTEQVMSRIDPSEFAPSRYMDGSRIGVLNVSFWAKSENQVTAANYLDLILTILDLDSNIEITGGLYIKCEGSAEPVYNSKDETGNFIFTCSVIVEFHAV